MLEDHDNNIQRESTHQPLAIRKSTKPILTFLLLHAREIVDQNATVVSKGNPWPLPLFS